MCSIQILKKEDDYGEVKNVFSGRGWYWNSGNYFDIGGVIDACGHIPQPDYIHRYHCIPKNQWECQDNKRKY